MYTKTTEESISADSIPHESVPDVDALEDEGFVTEEFILEDPSPDRDGNTKSVLGEFISEDSTPDIDATTKEKSTPVDFILCDSSVESPALEKKSVTGELIPDIDKQSILADFIPRESVADGDALEDKEFITEKLILEDSSPNCDAKTNEDFEETNNKESVPRDFIPENCIPDFDALKDEESVKEKLLPEDSMSDFDATKNKKSITADLILRDSILEFDVFGRQRVRPRRGHPRVLYPGL